MRLIDDFRNEVNVGKATEPERSHCKYALEGFRVDQRPTASVDEDANVEFVSLSKIGRDKRTQKKRIRIDQADTTIDRLLCRQNLQTRRGGQKHAIGGDALHSALAHGYCSTFDRLTQTFINAFVAGEVFSTYVYQRFSEALRERVDVMVQVRADSVAAIGRHAQGGLSLLSGEGEQARFDAVFLATGYGLRSCAGVDDSQTAVRDALVIGGGIHAVDRALRLLAAGEASHVTLISASGFLPQPHTPWAVGITSSSQPFPKTLRGAFRYLREAASKAAAEGSGWQGIMNDFRLRAHDLWQALTPEERRRFKRHVKPIYDSHRNRLPIGH
ncbi:FAD/NAD(P)-binding protein [Ensifer adhaerens]|nr:FAD/NAD(P)-binding protein [Ensifer adhaerens]MBZ7927385.1 FAD/NAD(P)-binding protein [Ensifer adhaerens]